MKTSFDSGNLRLPEIIPLREVQASECVESMLGQPRYFPSTTQFGFRTKVNHSVSSY